MRALAERPLHIQGSVKIANVYDVPVKELPVRVLGDCLRGSPALHSDLPHNPAVRAQAALAIAQWQNNKAPNSRDAVGVDSWLGLNILMQYFKERYYSHGVVMPNKFTRMTIKNPASGGQGGNTEGASDAYQYLDTFADKEERERALKFAEEIETEEDEEYRVRAAVITAAASVRAKDGMTPPIVLTFLEAILHSIDGSSASNLISPEENDLIRRRERRKRTKRDNEGKNDSDVSSRQIHPNGDVNVDDLPYVSSSLVADALLALCYINVRPALIDDPEKGTQIQSKEDHPVLPLMEACHRWLDWELYRESIRCETEMETMTGVGGGCYSTIAPCAITALCSLALLRQSTTDAYIEEGEGNVEAKSTDCPLSGTKRKSHDRNKKSEEAATAQFYVDIFDSRPIRSDATRAAAAQALACICCAADRLEYFSAEPVGLLTALEFMLERILEPTTSPSLRQTLASLMLDASQGKVCSLQRVATIAGRGDLCTSGVRFMAGSLGASYGGDNGSALLMTVSEATHPAANAVNDGARRSLSLLQRCGRDMTYGEAAVARVATFATVLWRTINGEHVPSLSSSNGKNEDFDGVCAFDGHLRCALLALFQWIWPKGSCNALLRVQLWGNLEGTDRYRQIGADEVMKTTKEEKEAAAAEEVMFHDLAKTVSFEIDRQKWRGEMATKAYEYSRKDDKGGAAKDGIGQPLSVVQKDDAWKLGGWAASATQQRRAKGEDGGSAGTKIRLRAGGGG